MQQKFVKTNGIQLAYLDQGGSGEPLILMHGLSANSHHFDGLIAAGLAKHFHVLAVDLRGRGLSDKPAGKVYSPQDHATDILSFMDALNLDRVLLGGHSYGGLMTMYIGAHHPERVKKMIILDAGIMHPQVKDLIAPAIKRLGQYAGMAQPGTRWSGERADRWSHRRYPAHHPGRVRHLRQARHGLRQGEQR